MKTLGSPFAAALLAAAAVLCACQPATTATTTRRRTTATITVTAEVVTTGETESGRGRGPPEDAHRTETRATVRCADIRPATAEAAAEAEDDEDVACASHCVRLAGAYDGGGCVAGDCRCRRRVPPGEDGWGIDDPHPVVACVDLIPSVGEESEHNDEACRLHCATLGGGYRRGQCLRGLCFCSWHL